MPISTELLTEARRYSPLFVETGSHQGKTIDKALLAGFERIKSVEITEQFYVDCKEKYKWNHAVELFFGLSDFVIPRMIRHAKCRITFWLDAHYIGDEFEYYGRICPVLEELAAISKHLRHDHIILIDDARLFRITGNPIKKFTGEFEIQIEKVYDAILSVNPDYRIIRLPGLIEDDIIAAIPPDLTSKLYTNGPSS